jgi:hypothetical protein
VLCLITSLILCALTKSFACCLSVFSSCFSRDASSLNVGLKGFRNLVAVPGVFIADLSGGLASPFVFGARVACCSTGLLSEIYPKPTSDGFANVAGAFDLEKGRRCSFGSAIGELTEVASAKRAFRGVLSDGEEDELEFVLTDLVVAPLSFFSLLKPMCGVLRDPSTKFAGETGV